MGMMFVIRMLSIVRILSVMRLLSNVRILSVTMIRTGMTKESLAWSRTRTRAAGPHYSFLRTENVLCGRKNSRASESVIKYPQDDDIIIQHILAPRISSHSVLFDLRLQPMKPRAKRRRRCTSIWVTLFFLSFFLLLFNNDISHDTILVFLFSDVSQLLS